LRQNTISLYLKLERSLKWFKAACVNKLISLRTNQPMSTSRHQFTLLYMPFQDNAVIVTVELCLPGFIHTNRLNLFRQRMTRTVSNNFVK